MLVEQGAERIEVLELLFSGKPQDGLGALVLVTQEPKGGSSGQSKDAQTGCEKFQGAFHIWPPAKKF